MNEFDEYWKTVNPAPCPPELAEQIAYDAWEARGQAAAPAEPTEARIEEGLRVGWPNRLAENYNVDLFREVAQRVYRAMEAARIEEDKRGTEHVTCCYCARHRGVLIFPNFR